MSFTPIGCIRLTWYFTMPGKAYREPQPHMVNGALPNAFSRLCYADYATLAWRGVVRSHYRLVFFLHPA
jgi:hypothetical protein